jgi:hypothetical protein
MKQGLYQFGKTIDRKLSKYTGDLQQRVITSYRENSNSGYIATRRACSVDRQCVLRVASTYQWYRYYNTMGLQREHWMGASGQIEQAEKYCDQQPETGERGEVYTATYVANPK